MALFQCFSGGGARTTGKNSKPQYGSSKCETGQRLRWLIAGDG